jgi:hypothetical protein
MVIIMIKECLMCNKEFVPKINTKKYCSKKCSRRYWIANNKDKIKKYAKKDYEKYKDKRKKDVREYYYNNKEKKLEYQNQYYLDNKENILKNINKPKRRKYMKKYKEENKEKLIKYGIDYCRKRRHRDIGYRILHNVRCKMSLLIKKNGRRTVDIIGCSIDELKHHLESKFTEGMSWDNYGLTGWHIDHIIPCASFDLSNPEEQKKCFHYTNLQPLWAKDNQRKGDKIV